MKTHYSIIKVVPNSIVSDTIGVGIVLFNNEGAFVKFSKEKIKIAISLLGDRKNLIEYFLKNIERSVLKFQVESNITKNNLFHVPNKVSAEYLTYLHRYSNNTIQFSEPIIIHEDLNQDTFERLYILLIENVNLVKEKHITHLPSKTIENIQVKLISRVKEKVHTNVKFNDAILPTLYFKYEMDCIGLNGVFTGAKSINFNQSEITIQKEMSNYYALSSMLENKYGKYGSENNFFLICDEPENIGSKEHQLWEKIRQTKKFKFIQSEESDVVADAIDETGARRFLDIEQS